METPETLPEPPSPAYPQPDAEGNYHPPPMMALRLVWRDFKADIATEQDVATVIQAVSDFATFQLESLQSQIERGESDAEDQSLKLILQGFEENLQAVEVMFMEFEEPAVGHFESGLEIAQRAANRLMEGHLHLMQTVEAMSKSLCMFCNQENPRGAERCSRCRRVLPPAHDAPEKTSFTAISSPGGNSEGASGEVTQNFAKIEQGYQAWRSGSLDEESFTAVQAEIENALRSHQEDNQRNRDKIAQAPEQYRDGLTHANDLTDQALEQSLTAMERFRRAFQREDDANLELALDDLRAASTAMVGSYYATKEAMAPK